MKCQRCPKAAALHITEIQSEDQVEELHLCEECAQKYLHEPSGSQAAGAAAHVAEESEEGAGVSHECDVCGIKFVDFRNSGRLGCPHDYSLFREELLPLLENIHGETKHVGKSPRRFPQNQQKQAELTTLRKQLVQAVNKEDYEEAARLRDLIRQVEA
jgi:protein arginine kinase activator